MHKLEPSPAQRDTSPSLTSLIPPFPSSPLPPPLLLLPSSSLPLFLLPPPPLPHQESSELESLLRLLQLGLKSLNIMDTKDYREDNLVCNTMFTSILAMYLKPFSQTGSFVMALGSACFLKLKQTYQSSLLLQASFPVLI